MKLQGKTALITGAATGIGRAIAIAYAKEGANIVLNHFNTNEEAEDLRRLLEKEYDVKAEVVQADVSDEAQVKSLVKATIEKFGKIDILVNSAGILTQYPIGELKTEEWDRMIAINLRGPFLCIKETLPYMMGQKSGRIINIASQLGQIGGVELAHYCASKAGVIGMTKSIAREVGQYGITANCIAPGPIETTIIRDLDSKWKEQKAKELAIPRFGLPEEVAPAAVLLASDPGGNLFTGQTLGPNSGDVML